MPEALTSRYGMTPAQLLLNWVTFREAVVAIPKAASKQHVEENANAVSARLSANDYALLSERFP